MDNISSLLAQKNLSEPPEIKVIKDYVFKKYGVDISVRVDNNKVIIYANNSALASSIRMNIPDIKKVCNNDKRIVIYLKN